MWKNKQKLNKELLQNISLVSQLGLSVIFSILIMFFIFLFLDRKFDTNGILTLAGVILGIMAGLLSAYKLLKRFYQKNE